MRTPQAKRKNGPRGRYDRWLLLAALTLVCLGIVMVTSSSIAVASGNHVGAFYYLFRHLVFLAIGAALALIAARTELAWVEKCSPWLVAMAVLLLLAVFAPGIGMRINGASRWLDLGITTAQPVEVVKLIMVLYLASYLVRHRERVEHQFFGVVRPLGVTLLMAALLLAQPDFGSAALLLAVTVGMIWLGGGRMRNLLYMALPLVPVICWVALSEDYRVKRLTSFLNPWKDPFDDGFQLTQALIAIGRGEWFGVGLGASIQKLFYLPEAHTDFILAVIAEELGLAGVLLVLGLYALLIGRALAIGFKGVRLGQRYAAFVAFGVALCIGLQALVSAGVNLGVLPTKGLTLPLISSGGSSVVMTCAMLGVLLRAGFEISRAEDARQMATRSASRALAEQAPA